MMQDLRSQDAIRPPRPAGGTRPHGFPDPIRRLPDEITTMADTNAIRERVKGIGAYGAHIGTMGHVEGGRIKLMEIRAPAGSTTTSCWSASRTSMAAKCACP